MWPTARWIFFFFFFLDHWKGIGKGSGSSWKAVDVFKGPFTLKIVIVKTNTGAGGGGMLESQGSWTSSGRGSSLTSP